MAGLDGEAASYVSVFKGRVALSELVKVNAQRGKLPVSIVMPKKENGKILRDRLAHVSESRITKKTHKKDSVHHDNQTRFVSIPQGGKCAKDKIFAMTNILRNACIKKSHRKSIGEGKSQDIICLNIEMCVPIRECEERPFSCV